jgi:riboflavin kinase, archaea type
MRRLTGVIFSDLGQAAFFMELDWVQRALQKSLGFAAVPATLNVRPNTTEDAELWERVQKESKGISLLGAEGGFCSARLYPVEMHRPVTFLSGQVHGAVLLPEVANYPKDKIEIVAPVRVKEALNVRDGDQLVLEFVS